MLFQSMVLKAQMLKGTSLHSFPAFLFSISHSHCKWQLTHYAGIPASTHLRKRAICSSGHFPSHGILPLERRPRMA